MTEGSVYASTPFAGAELNSSSSIKINKIGVKEHVLDIPLDAIVFVGMYRSGDSITYRKEEVLVAEGRSGH